jgi:ribulose bisphosphate carboxylase small subunit
MMDTYTANDLYAARGHFARLREQLEATQAMAWRISDEHPDAPRSTEEYMTRVALAAIDAEIARRLLTELAEIVQ